MISPCKNKPIHKLQYAPQNVDTSINDLVCLNLFYEDDSFLLCLIVLLLSACMCLTPYILLILQQKVRMETCLPIKNQLIFYGN